MGAADEGGGDGLDAQRAPVRDTSALAADLEALCAVERRFAGSEAERRMLDAVRARLPAGTVARAEGFVGHTAPRLVLGFHGVAALLSALVGLYDPRLGALGSLLTAASLVGEGTGRLGLLRFWLPRVPSYNLVVPPPAGEVLGTLVLCAPLDVPRSRPWRGTWPRRPNLGVLVSAGAVTALLLLRALSEPFGTPLLTVYVGAVAVLLATAVLGLLSRRPTRAARNDAGGPAVVLEVLRRIQAAPPPGLAVWTVFTGCGRAFQDGMKTFLLLRGQRLPRPVLVLSVVEADRPTLHAVTSEGPLWPQHHRPTGPALAERLRWAGARLPEADRPEPTDARAAMILGYRALALVGGEGEPSVAGAARSADVVEAVLRWYAADLAQVAADAPGVADRLG